MSMRRSFPAALWAMASIASTAGTALAQPTEAPGGDAPGEAVDPKIGQARDAFLLGTALANQGQWPEALAAFERSSQLHPHPVTTYNTAYSERALGHYARAYKLFVKTLAEHEAAALGTLPEELLALAKGYVSEVERRLARVSVRVEPPDLAISVDGRPLEALSLSGASAPVLLSGTRDERGSEVAPSAAFELWIDPGRHVFVLSRPGSADRVITETFDPGAARELLLRGGEQPEPAAPQAEPPPKPIVMTTAAPDRTWVYVAYGVGGAGVIAGATFGVLAANRKGYLDDHCRTPSACDPEYQGDIDAMNLQATIADVGWGVAVLGAGVGTYLLLSGTPAEQEESRPATASVRVWLGPSSVGARGRW